MSALGRVTVICKTASLRICAAVPGAEGFGRLLRTERLLGGRRDHAGLQQAQSVADRRAGVGAGRELQEQ